MTADYAWLITHDSIADDDYPAPSNSNARGMTGPHDVSEEFVKILHRAASAGKDKWQGEPVQWFKIYDGDDELYYSGVFLAAELSDSSEEASGFEPLYDFGTPNAGAVYIKYYNSVTKQWDML